MTNPISRRVLIGGLLAAAATGACAKAPETSPRPLPRPLRGRASAAADAEALIADARLGGRVSYLVADARTGDMLEGRNMAEAMAPASTAKTLTTLYAFDRLGTGHRYTTALVADGPVANGRVSGDLVLVGGGDPTLDTDGLAELAAALRAKGITEVTGRLRYWGGALPYLHEITGGQPDHLGYNPAVSGLNLNYNRVFFEWKRAGKGYDVSMDARSDNFRPAVTTSRMTVADRSAPVYTYREKGNEDLWTVARGALGKGGGRWLPVRHPACYAGGVFLQLAKAQGISIAGFDAATRAPSGPALVARQSDDLRSIAKDMLKYSTNMTAEVLGMSASGASTQRASAAAMDGFLAQTYGCRRAKMFDHSGLGDDSRMNAEDMVSVLVGSGPGGALRPLLKDIPMKDSQGRPIRNHEMKVNAKTGTLNFVSCLAGYAMGPTGRLLAFTIFTGDLRRRSALDEDEQDRPPGAAAWNARSKHLQQKLIERWGRAYGA